MKVEDLVIKIQNKDSIDFPSLEPRFKKNKIIADVVLKHQPSNFMYMSVLTKKRALQYIRTTEFDLNVIKQVNNPLFNLIDSDKKLSLALFKKKHSTLEIFTETNPLFHDDSFLLNHIETINSLHMVHKFKALLQNKDLAMQVQQGLSFILHLVAPELQQDKEFVKRELLKGVGARPGIWAMIGKLTDNEEIKQLILDQEPGLMCYHPVLSQNKDYILTAMKSNSSISCFCWGLRSCNQKSLVPQRIREDPLIIVQYFRLFRAINCDATTGADVSCLLDAGLITQASFLCGGFRIHHNALIKHKFEEPMINAIISETAIRDCFACGTELVIWQHNPWFFFRYTNSLRFVKPDVNVLHCLINVLSKMSTTMTNSFMSCAEDVYHNYKLYNSCCADLIDQEPYDELKSMNLADFNSQSIKKHSAKKRYYNNLRFRQGILNYVFRHESRLLYKIIDVLCRGTFSLAEHGNKTDDLASTCEFFRQILSIIKTGKHNLKPCNATFQKYLYSCLHKKQFTNMTIVCIL